VTVDPTRIVVTGASGNVGTGVLRALARELPGAEVVGVCRRPPTGGADYERVHWHAVDLSRPDAALRLIPAMRDADVVVHLALAVKPVLDDDYLYRANVRGSQAVLSAMTAAGVGQLVYASSLGIYAPGGGSTPVAEEWPDTGQDTSTYSRHKVVVERLLDEFERDHPDVAVSRFRPTVVVQREAAYLIRSLYLGPLVPRSALQMLRRRQLPVLPLPAGTALQFVHADDVGDAVVRMIRQRARGSFNVAADVVDARALGELVGGRPIALRPALVRSVVSALSAARVIALTPGWYDVAFNTPVMDTTKAQRVLGWTPAHSSTQSARELIEGLADEAVGDSAATGLNAAPRVNPRAVVQLVHDASLMSWGALTVLRAAGFGRPGVPDRAVMALNLVSGTPMAIDRVLERRRDPVALLAPAAVVAALAASVRGGWPAVATTAVLQVLNVLERRAGTTRSA
jgi:UDP-glucose 4-epimerase